MAISDPYQQAGARAGPAAIPQAQPAPQRGSAAPQTPAEARGLPGASGSPPGQPLPAAAYGVPVAQPVAPAAARVAARPVGQPAAAVSKSAATRPVVVVGPGAAGKTARSQDEGEEGHEEFAAVAVRSAPPWLISAAVHMIGLIILGLIVYAAKKSGGLHELKVETVYAEQLGEQLEFDSPLGVDKTAQADEPVITPDNLREVPDPFAAPAKLDISPDGMYATSDIDANQIGLALTGRQEGTKKSLLGRYGGTATTEKAVRAGLEWLARNQGKNGSWSLSGPFGDGVPREMDNPEAATAMALLAFQGHGDTHKDGSYKKNVIEGWKWLAKQQDADGNFYHNGPFNHRFYTQGQCTIAACELYGMTKDPKFKEIAERALENCLKSQAAEGGWRYSPNVDSDVSVTGWIVMALQSAKMAKLEVPEDNLRRVERFLDNVAQRDGSRYPYQRGGQIKLSMTAEALLCRQYLGWRRDDPRLVEGADYITANLINFKRERDVYYWYYATQVMHHMEGDHWKRWNAVMRQIMPEQQVPKGKEAGSWDPARPSEDQWAPHGGRLYVTCLSIYMLEVYYRHLPIYTKIYTNLLKSGRTPGT